MRFPWSRSKTDRWLDRTQRHLVIVELKDSSSIKGVLVDVCADGISLEYAAYVDASGETRFDGEVFIPHGGYRWIQHPRSDAS